MENEKLWAYIGILEPAYSVMKDKCEELVLKDLSSRNLPDPNDLTIAESSETKEQIDSHSEQNLLQRSKSLRKFCKKQATKRIGQDKSPSKRNTRKSSITTTATINPKNSKDTIKFTLTYNNFNLKFKVSTTNTTYNYEAMKTMHLLTERFKNIISDQLRGDDFVERSGVYVPGCRSTGSTSSLSDIPPPSYTSK